MSLLSNIQSRIPIIKNIPGFSTLPEGLNPVYLRFYKLANLVHSLAMFTHGAWVLLFLYLAIPEMVILNIISFAVYVFNIVINRRGYHFASICVMLSEIIIHQMIAIRLLGWGSGFQYYLLVIGILPFLMPRGRIALKVAFMLCGFLAYLLAMWFMRDLAASYVLSEWMRSFFEWSNLLFTFVFMGIGGAYFNNAMYETISELDRKNQQLISAEKRATMGELATRMAHEIQNPINFVNNFSRINEDLLEEFREESKTAHLSEAADSLLFDLEENSKKISNNGKRVAEIVRSLQDQVNKQERNKA